jgi:predicted ATPase
MPRYILTGAPGSGKTAVLRQLEINGHTVVEEAATDVIALDQARGCEEPWREHAFIDRIVTLQQRRQLSVREDTAASVFFDRSPVCTLALSRHLGFPMTDLLAGEVDRVARDRAEITVFFIRNLGFVHPTSARRITFEDALVFERRHEESYRELGFQLVEVPAGPLADRVALIEQTAD